MSLVEVRRSCRRIARALAAFTLGASACGCSFLVTDPPPDDAGASTAIIITGVDGTGSALAPSPGAAAVSDAVPAPHRLRDELVVSGVGLAAVTEVSLASSDLSLQFTSLAFEHEGAPDVSIRVSLPAGLRAGLYTLGLVTSAGMGGAAQTASAQVFLLQGEPGPAGADGAAGAEGPRGPAGAPALASLTRVVTLAAGDPSCARGGASVISGTDLDGDGALDDNEVETSAAACHGDPGLECAGGACVLAADLEVQGSVSVPGPAGALLEVVGLVTAATTFTVGPSNSAAFPDLPSALTALSRVRIASDARVTLQLEAGTHLMSAPLVIAHPDGARLVIVGADLADPAATVLQFAPETLSHGVQILSGGLAALNGLTLRNVGHFGGHGVVVLATSARLGPKLVIEGFAVGISAYRNAAVNADGDASDHVVVSGHRFAFYSQNALLQAGFAVATAPDTALPSAGFHANIGGQIYAGYASASGHTFGALASFDSLIYAPNAVIVGPGAGTDTKGFLAQHHSIIEAASSTVSDVMFAYQAVNNSGVLAAGHQPTSAVTIVYCVDNYSHLLEGSPAIVRIDGCL